MPDGYLYSMGITKQLILFGALSGALYYVYRWLALQGRVVHTRAVESSGKG